jgi:hypothetical protein
MAFWMPSNTLPSTPSGLAARGWKFTVSTIAQKVDCYVCQTQKAEDHTKPMALWHFLETAGFTHQ